MNDLPPPSNPAPQPQEPAPQYAAPGSTPPPQPAWSPPYAPPLAAAGQPPPTTPPWMGTHAAHGAPPPAGPGLPPIQPAWPAGYGPPPDYKTGATFMLVGSITTLVLYLGWTALFVCGLVTICLVCCTLPLVGVAVWSLVSAGRALGGAPVRSLRVASALGLVASLLTFDVIGIVMQILALVWFSKPDVSEWIERGG